MHRLPLLKRLAVTVAALSASLAAPDVSVAQGWLQLTTPSANIGPIACSADGSKLLLASGYRDDQGGVLYVSHDSGATWTTADVPAGLWSAVASSAEGTVLTAVMATYNQSGTVYISTDSGTNWSRAALPVALWEGVACSANGAALYATASRTTNGSPEGIYASADGGATWSPAGAPPPTTNGDWGPLACSADGMRVMVGEGPCVWISTNAGMNLRLAFTLDPPYLVPGDRFVCASLACSADGGKVAVGAEAGEIYTQVAVATSGDSGATWAWTSATNDWLCSIWRPVCVSADGHRLAVAEVDVITPVGMLPTGPVLVSEDAGVSWVEPPGVADPGWSGSAAPWTGLAMSADASRLTGVFVDGFDLSDPSVVVQQAAPAPMVGIAVSTKQLVLSWIVPSVSLALQQSSNIGAANWTDVPGAPVLNYSTLRQEVTVPSSGKQMFYRLVSRP